MTDELKHTDELTEDEKPELALEAEPETEESVAEEDVEQVDQAEEPDEAEIVDEAEQAEEPADELEEADPEQADEADEVEPADEEELADDDQAEAADAPAEDEADEAEESAPAHAAHARPDSEALQAELSKARQRNIFFRVLRSTIFSLVVVAAVAVIIATLVLPILQISGTSMTDTLQDQDIVVAVRTSDCQTGDVIAFYYNNKILVKRVIANSGQWVDIDKDGNVYVDNVLIDEPYVKDKALGDCNIKLPYQVPESRIFVMGDHRSVSVDSRSTTVGCVANEQIVGKLLFCAWPLEDFGLVQ